MDKTGIIGASLYNAIGGRRAPLSQGLGHYVEDSIASQARRYGGLALREGIGTFLHEISE
jgi:hypothetical protein